MKKYGILMLAGGLLAISAGFADVHATATTSTTTTVQTPEQPAATTTTTTETTVQAPPVATPTTPTPVVVEPKPTARDAITGKPVDTSAHVVEEEKKSLRDEVRDGISEKAGAK